MLLDIVMPEMSGVELAAALREDGFCGEIVFLSTSKEYGPNTLGIGGEKAMSSVFVSFLITAAICFFLELVLTVLPSMMVDEIIRYFLGSEHFAYNILRLAVLIPVCTIYVILCTKHTLRHDYKYHLIAIGEYLSEDNKEELKRYLDGIKTQLVLRVKNSFDGRVNECDGRIKSMKKDGGFGLRSIEAVAARYDGELFLDWENGIFSTYVTMRL